MTGLECHHRFCTHCWTEYLTTKIMEEGLGQTISCAAHGCDILVDDATVMNLVKDSKVRLKYQLIITNSFVQVNRVVHNMWMIGSDNRGTEISFCLRISWKMCHHLHAYQNSDLRLGISENLYFNTTNEVDKALLALYFFLYWNSVFPLSSSRLPK